MAKEIRLDGPIGFFMNDSESFNSDLDNLDLKDDDRLTLIINSPGGSVIEGWGIYNRLKSLVNPIDVRIEGLAASIASLIALAGDTVKISEVGSFMIHRASTFAEGNQKDLEKQVETLKAIDETLITVYQSATDEDRETIEGWLDEEKWFTPDEAIEAGFASELINKVDARMAALYLPKSETMNKLEKLMKFLNSSEEEETEKTAEEIAAEEEAKKKEEEEAEAKKKKEEDEEAEDLTEDKVADMIAKAIEPLTTAVEALAEATKEAVETAQAAAPEVAETAIRKLVKGIKTDGKVPAANASMDGNGYVVPNAAFKDRMKEIEKETRLN